LERDAAGFTDQVRRRIQAQRTYVLEIDGALVFKVDLGARSDQGAELENLYTALPYRRSGHAVLSLGQICRHLLSSLPRLSMRVDEDHPALGAIARKVGFVPGRAQRLVVAE
jgi:predicted GNAT family acetyltransferase